MSERGAKWVMWVSVIVVILAIGGLIYTSIIAFTDTVDIIQMAIIPVLLLSVLNLVFLTAHKYQNRNGFIKTIRILSWLLPVFILIVFCYDAKWLSIDSDLLLNICRFGMMILIPIAMVYIFVIDNTKLIIGIASILSYIVLSLVLRRINFGNMEDLLVTSFLMIGCGMYLFGLNCIFTIVRNRFLKAITFIACLFIFFGSLIMMSFSLTYANTLLIIYSISVFLLTIIVLLSMPLSGYVQWSSMHKSILNKVLIPWVFILLIISIRFVFPDLNSLFFKKESRKYQEFIMYDYPVINKNGLEPE